jgi:quinol monooxygenase YgiN
MLHLAARAPCRRPPLSSNVRQQNKRWLRAHQPNTRGGSSETPENTQVIRIARLVVDENQLQEYKAALKEEVELSVKLEPGVLTLYAVSAKDNPTHFTILEIYADSGAYERHLKTPHFLKYKTATKNMVKSLELIESVPLVPEMKIK